MKQSEILTAFKNHIIKNTLVYIVSLVFAVLITILSVLFFQIKVNHGLNIYKDTGESYGKLKALNKYGKRAFTEDENFAFYEFNNAQLGLINDVLYEKKSASLVLRVKIDFPLNDIESLETVSSLPFVFGFLFDDDFKNKGSKFTRFNFDNNEHLIVNADLKEVLDVNTESYTFDVSFAFPVTDKKTLKKSVRGFFVNSKLPCSIEGSCIAETITGFDKSEKLPFWGFSSNGGKIDFNSNNFDFTGSEDIFYINKNDMNYVPVYKIAFSKNDNENINDRKYTFSFGGEKIRMKRLENAYLNCLSLQKPFSNMEITSGGENVLSVILKSEKLVQSSDEKYIEPIKTDPGLVLNWQKEYWRNYDYEIFEWDCFQNIIIFDTRTYNVQSKFFARLAFFTEKDGFRGRILSNDELKGKHDYNAHDYRASSLADFFNALLLSYVEPNPEEELLLNILLEHAIIKKSGDEKNPYTAGTGAVISISREIPSYNRKSLLTHEGFHALFFIDEDFQNFVSAVYETIDSDTRDFLIDYFNSQPTLGYDTNDKFLMHTEFMSYILQQPVNKVADYFLMRTNWASVMKYTPDLCEKIRQTKAVGFEDAAIILDDYVKDRFNVECGDISLLGY